MQGRNIFQEHEDKMNALRNSIAATHQKIINNVAGNHERIMQNLQSSFMNTGLDASFNDNNDNPHFHTRHKTTHHHKHHNTSTSNIPVLTDEEKHEIAARMRRESAEQRKQEIHAFELHKEQLEKQRQLQQIKLE